MLVPWVLRKGRKAVRKAIANYVSDKNSKWQITKEKPYRLDFWCDEDLSVAQLIAVHSELENFDLHPLMIQLSRLGLISR